MTVDAGDSVLSTQHSVLPHRRRALKALAVGVAFLVVRPAKATPEQLAAVLRETFGDREIRRGRVKLEIPRLAENGNIVPAQVSVESPMTEQSHVTEVLVVADDNPRSGVVTFHFSPASGVAEANTRIRLAKTQDVIAVAKMNDGSFFTTSKQVKVTIGGCGG